MTAQVLQFRPRDESQWLKNFERDEAAICKAEAEFLERVRDTSADCGEVTEVIMQRHNIDNLPSDVEQDTCSCPSCREPSPRRAATHSAAPASGHADDRGSSIIPQPKEEPFSG